MNQVRISERKEHDALKGHKYTFLRNRENLTNKQEVSLAEMIDLYPTLGQAYRLKELFNDLWSMPDKVSAEAFLKHRRAMLPHNILGLLSPTFIRLRSEWEMPWSPCVRLNYAQNPAPLRLPQMAGRLFGMQFLPPSRATSALRISELPCRLPGTKYHHSA